MYEDEVEDDGGNRPLDIEPGDTGVHLYEDEVEDVEEVRV